MLRMGMGLDGSWMMDFWFFLVAEYFERLFVYIYCDDNNLTRNKSSYQELLYASWSFSFHKSLL
jgi:hypothetical protein